MNRYRLLIVEDETASLLAMKDFFEGQGYDVDAARDLAAAESCLRDRRYDVILTDLRLSEAPNLDGLDVISRVRRAQPASRVVVLTALPAEMVDDSAVRRGADALVQKPTPLPVLADVMSRLLESRE